MELSLLTSRPYSRGIILDYPGGLNVITGVLRMKRGKQKRAREMGIGEKLELLLLAVRMEKEGQKSRHVGDFQNLERVKICFFP